MRPLIYISMPCLRPPSNLTWLNSLVIDKNAGPAELGRLVADGHWRTNSWIMAIKCILREVTDTANIAIVCEERIEWFLLIGCKRGQYRKAPHATHTKATCTPLGQMITSPKFSSFALIHRQPILEFASHSSLSHTAAQPFLCFLSRLLLIKELDLPLSCLNKKL